MMIDMFFKKTILRHLTETRLFFSDLTEDTNLTNLFQSGVIEPD